MADYEFNFFKGYDSAGNESAVLGSSGGAGGALTTITDNDGGSAAFETTDTGIDDPSGILFFDNGTYLGSFVQVLDGQPITFLVVQNPFGDTYAFGNLPASINLTGPQIDAAMPDTLPVLDTNPLPVCFAAGTLIATPEGETAVETLEIGDLVRTQDGRDVPVKWIGRQTVHKLFTPAERFCPIRVSAGALGNGLPHTDLVLTSDHALILDGFAVNAGALVNGTTITRESMDSLPDRVTYYHVETEEHDVILANGAPAETYVDYVQRAAFDNHAEYVELYGEERTITEMPLPRISAARMLPAAIRARLEARDAA